MAHNITVDVIGCKELEVQDVNLSGEPLEIHGDVDLGSKNLTTSGVTTLNGDLVVNGVTVPNLLFLDVSADKILIGTDTPYSTSDFLTVQAPNKKGISLKSGMGVYPSGEEGGVFINTAGSGASIENETWHAGNGGAFSLVSGGGGNITHTDYIDEIEAGTGGQFTLSSGLGGVANGGSNCDYGQGGSGGAFFILGAKGGAALNSILNYGGGGGAIFLTAGNGGTGNSQGGRGGSLSLTAGNGVATNGASGDINLTVGSASGTGAVGKIVYTANTHTFVPKVANKDITFNFTGTSNSGQFLWMEDENYFQFNDDIYLLGGENLILSGTTGTKIGTATTQKLGFWNVTPVVQQATNAYTSDGEGSAYTGIDNLQVGTVYATVADLNTLRVAYETLRASYDDLRTKLITTGIVA